MPVKRRKKRLLLTLFRWVSILLILLVFVSGPDLPLASPHSVIYAPSPSSDTKPSSAATTSSAPVPDVSSGPSSTSSVPAVATSSSAPSSSQTSPKVDYSYFDDAVFVGDSLTTDIGNYEKMDKATVIASIGASTYTAYQNHQIVIDSNNKSTGWIPALVAAKQPKKIYIMFGSNDLGWMTVSQYTEYYGHLIDYFTANCPGVIIYVQSILPIAARAENTSGPNGWSFDNIKIDNYNTALRSFCASKGVRYLDVASVIKGPDGKLPDNVTDDGVHLRSAEYEKWFTYLLANP